MESKIKLNGMLLLILSFFIFNLNGWAKFEPMLDETALNRSIDPCTDFFAYACDGWKDRTKLPDDEPAWTRSFSTIHNENLVLLRTILENYASGHYSPHTRYSNKLGDFYTSCMNEKSAEEATRDLLPKELATIDYIGKEKALTEGIADLHLKGVSVFFSIDSNPDWKNSSQMVAVIDQGGLGLPNRDYYFDQKPDKIKIREQYQTHISKMLALIGVDSETAQSQAKEIFSFESELAKHALSPHERRDPDKLYHPVGKKELEEWAPAISWKELFSKLQIGEIGQLNVTEPEFIKGMGELLAKSSPERIKTYLRWHFLNKVASTLGKELDSEHFNFYGLILSGQKQQKPRWKRCISATDSLFRDALGQAFVKKHFGKEGKAKGLEILKNIQLVFEENLNHVQWMDDATRKLAVQKLKHIQNKIGYPDKWRDLSRLKIQKNSYFTNYLAATRFWRIKDLKKVGKPVDRTEWLMTPPTVNAYYSPEQNEIVFPAGILQSPIFSSSAITAANYGAFGVVIGHELTHGFDDEGRKYDSVGNLQDWWSPQVATIFSKKAQCIEDQYSKYTVAEGTPINGKLTLGENIADLGGVKIAYQAFQKSRPAMKEISKTSALTEDQKFFIAFAQVWCNKTTPAYEKLHAAIDPHAPQKYRVNGVMVNTPEFAEAFGCSLNTPMNPTNRCSVW